MATIDAATLRDWLQDGRPVTVVDTLPAAVYARGHIPGAIHIVSDDILAQAATRLPERDAVVVVYCASEACRRAWRAAERLASLGYTQVHRLEDGKRGWLAAGGSLVTGDPAS